MKVLIVGCERSGTTAIASILSKSSKKTLLNDPADSWYIFPLVKLVGIKGFTLSLVYRLWKHDIVKVPGFASILFQLRKIQFRKFRVVYVVRDPRDNYAAIKERLSSQDLNGLYINTHFLGRVGKTIPENIGIKWSEYLKNALEYQSKYPNDILFVRYEDFIARKEKTISEIADFAKLKIDPSIVRQLMDQQLNKNWSKKIKGAGRYKNDLEKDEIETIIRFTKEGMKLFNYS